MAQTIYQFLEAPFGEPHPKRGDLEQAYQRLKREKRISIAGYAAYEDNHLIHVEVGSERNQKESYDVVFYFYTDNPALQKSRSFRDFYVKFFSNAPSFIYQYAALYYKEGHLIDLFVDKMDPEWKDVLPKNITQLSYDKSIYCACRFLEDNRTSAYSTFIHSIHTKSLDRFIKGIRGFEDIKIVTELATMDKQIKREVKEESKPFKHGGVKSTTIKASSGLKKTSIIKPKRKPPKHSNLSQAIKPSKVLRGRKSGKKRSTFK